MDSEFGNIDDELIDAYLERHLSASELSEFESRLTVEPELVNSLAFAMQVKKASAIVAESMEIKSNLSSIDWGRSPVKLWPSIARWSAVAMMFLVSLLYFQPGKQSNRFIFEQGIGREINIDELQQTTGGSRGAVSSGDTILTSGQSESLLVAIHMLNRRDSLNAFRHLIDLQKTHPSNPDILFYLGVAELKIGRVDDAIKHLSSPKGPKGAGRRNYYLALAYIQKGQNRKAKAILSKLTKTRSVYTPSAKDILGKLRWSIF